MENEKVFLSQQLICMLPPMALKVMAYLLNWQKMEVIKYYPKQMCDFMHINSNDLDLGIQTLINHKLIDISNIDGGYGIQINKETVNKYFNVKLQNVKEHKGLEMATEVIWKQEEKKSQDISDLSDDELKLLLLRIEASLSERQQMKNKVVKPEEKDDLPW